MGISHSCPAQAKRVRDALSEALQSEAEPRNAALVLKCVSLAARESPYKALPLVLDGVLRCKGSLPGARPCWRSLPATVAYMGLLEDLGLLARGVDDGREESTVDAAAKKSDWFVKVADEALPDAALKSNLQPDFNVRVIDRFDAKFSAVLRELDESNRSVQKSA